MFRSKGTGTSRPKWYVRRHGKPPYFESYMDIILTSVVVGVIAMFVYMIVSIK